MPWIWGLEGDEIMMLRCWASKVDAWLDAW